jgi:hypothetical protein
MPGVDIDFALIADHAELVNGKLYLMGGGWDTYNAPAEPIQLQPAIALGVRIGWEETNRNVPVRVTIEDDDGAEMVRADGTLMVGRPPGLEAGSTQLAQMTARLPLMLPRFGGYRVHVTVGTGETVVERFLPFRIVRT